MLFWCTRVGVLCVCQQIAAGNELGVYLRAADGVDRSHVAYPGKQAIA